jgi:hypothetical protein
MGAGPFVAHAGEEVLLVVAVGWIVYLLVKGMRGGRSEAPAAGPCLYCGAMLPRGVSRCPTCGFRARPGGPDNPLSPPATVRTARRGTPGPSP